MTTGGNHSPRRTDVEQIVRAVLAEMTRPRRGATAPDAQGELVLTGKVVSLAEVEDRLHGVSRLVVPRGAVLTPAARDELRKHRVSIASAVTVASAAAPRVVLAVAETDNHAAPLAARLAADGLSVERCSRSDLMGAIDQLCEIVTQGEMLGLLITRQSAAAICLANRKRGVRAALGGDVRHVADAIAEIGTNLLVVNPKGKSVFEMSEMARAFVRGGRPQCPPALEPYLDGNSTGPRAALDREKRT